MSIRRTLRLSLPTVALLLLATATAHAAEPKAVLLHSPPAQATAQQALQVDGSLSSGTLNFAQVLLRYRGPFQEYVETKMELQYGDLYRGFIPASKMTPPGVEYYVEGVTSNGEKLALFGTASKPARVLVLADDSAGPAVEPKEKEEPKEEPKPIVEKAEPKNGKKKKKKKNGKAEPEEPLAPVSENNPYAEPKEAPKEPSPKEEPKEEPKVSAEPEPEEVKVAEAPQPKGKKKQPPPEETAPEPEPVPEPALKPSKQDRTQSRAALKDELDLYAEYAPGIAASLDPAERQSAFTRHVLTHEQLRQLAARHVYDVLDLVPGLTVSRDVQGFWRVAARGLRTEGEILWRLDGQKLNNFYDAKVLAQIPIDNLDRIEVTLGPGNVENGPGAFLAVIDLYTRRDDGLRASASAGLWETFDGHLSAAKTFGGLKVFGDADVLSQYGYVKPVLTDALDSTTRRAQRTLDDPAGRTSDKRFFVNAGLGVEYASSLGTFHLNGRFQLENRAALIGQFDAIGNDSSLQTQNVFVNAGWERKLGKHGEAHANLFFDLQSFRRVFQLTPKNFRAGNRTAEEFFFPNGIIDGTAASTLRFGLDAGLHYELPFNNLFGASLQAEYAALSRFDYLANYTAQATPTYVSVLSRPDGIAYPTEVGGGAAARRISFGLALSDRWTPVERLSIDVGVRLDFQQLPVANAAGVISGSGFGIGLGPRLGVVFTPVDALALRALYTRAWRPPTVQEYAEPIANIGNNQGRFTGNGALRPTNADRVEAGFSYAQNLGEARLVVGATAFFESISDAIAQIDDSGNLVATRNRAEGVRVFGGEGEARLELSKRSSVFVNASFFRAEDVGTVAIKRLLTDTPQARFNAGVSLPLGPYFHFDVTLHAGSERRNNGRSQLEVIRRYRIFGYAIVNAALRTELLADHFSLGVMAQNAFDFDQVDDVPRPDRLTSPEHTTGFLPREGINVFATARAEF